MNSPKGSPSANGEGGKEDMHLKIPRRLSLHESPKSPTPSVNSQSTTFGLKLVPLGDHTSFSHFRLHDTRPRLQRKLLFALNIRSKEVKKQFLNEEVMTSSGGLF